MRPSLTWAIVNPSTNGATAAAAYYGGGALMDYYANVTVNNCTFINNTASYWGAIYTNGQTLVLTNSTLIGNNATDDGAIYNDIGVDTVQFNSIIDNTGSSHVYNLDADGGTVDARYNWGVLI